MRGLGLVGDPTSQLLGTTNQVAVYRIPYTQPDVRDGGSPARQLTAVDAAATWELDIPWHWQQQAAMQILGFSWRDVASTKPKILRYLPEYDPEYTVIDFGGSVVTPFMTATKVSIKGISPKGFSSLNMANVVGEDAAGSGGSGDAYGGLSKDAPKYILARLTINYDFLPYDVLPNPTGQTTLYTVGSDGTVSTSSGWAEYSGGKLRWVSFEMKPAAEYLSVPATVNSKDGSAQSLKWADNSVASRIKTNFPGNVGYIVGNKDYKFTWHQVPFDAIPNTTIQNTMGRVNLRSITLPGGQGTTAKPGQLLMLAVDTRRIGSPYGNRLWDVEYTFRYNPRGHNNFYDWVAGDWFQASKDGNYYGYDEGSGSVFPAVGSVMDHGNPPPKKLLYDSVDYNKLFVPE